MNIVGVPAEALRRGEVLTHPGQYSATRRIDAHVRLLPDASTRLTHNREIKLFIATSETIARVRLLGVDQLLPGEDGWLQLELQDPVVCARGDRLIFRLPSPAETVGGGTIVDPHPANRHKRFDELVLRALNGLAAGTPAEILLETALSVEPAPVRDIARRSGLTDGAVAAALTELITTFKIVALEAGTISVESETLLMSSSGMELLTERIEQTLKGFHAKFPLRRGMPREEPPIISSWIPDRFRQLLARLKNGRGERFAAR